MKTFSIPKSAIRILPLFLAVLLPGHASHAAPVVRVLQQQCQSGHCTQGWYSGVVIGRDEKTKQLVVVTVAHGWLPGVKTLVEVEAGQFETATVAGQSSTDDVTVLLVPHSARTEILPLGAAPPQKGQEVVVSGFQLGRKYFSRKARVKSYHGNWIRLNETVAQGESGGAVALDGELVGLIQGDTGPVTVMPGNGAQPSRFLSDGIAVSLTVIRKWVKQSLGSVPEAPLQPTPQSEPLPVAQGPAPSSSSRPADDAKPQAQHEGALTSAAGEKVAADVVAGVRAELPKILSEHLGPVEQRLQAEIAQHGLSLKSLPGEIKEALVPELPAIGKQIAGDAAPQVPGLLALLSKTVGLTALAGSTAGPLGTLIGLIGGAGYFLNRLAKRHATAVTSAINSQGSSSAAAPKSAPPPQLPPAVVAPVNAHPAAPTPAPAAAPTAGAAAPTTNPAAAPATTVNTSVAQITTEVGTEAYQRMKADLVKKNPALANDGTIKLMDSLFTQHLSGLQTTK